MPDTKDRKSKKSKKKQAMSEPVDLEAGEHVTEPEAPTIAKAIYEKPSDGDAAEGKTVVEVMGPTVSKSLGDSTVVDTSTSQTGKGALEGTQRASIPPPPKSKAKIHNTEDAIETVDGRSSRLKPARDPVNIKKVSDCSHDVTLVEIIDMETTNTFLQPDSAAKKAKIPVDTDKSSADTSKDVSKAKLQLMLPVSEISISPQLPKAKIETVKAVTKQKLRLCPLISAWSVEPSQGPVAEQSAQRKFSSGQQQQKATNTNQLPALPPFDHESFSRFDNIYRPTDNDFGSLIELQTNDGTFSHIHISILRQIPRFKELVDQNLPRLRNPTHAHAIRLRGGVDFVCSDFDGVSSTYIHWLYNGNLPTSIIDTRHGRTVSDVFLSLAEEYLIGARVSDGRYMNYIMDAFITLQVRTRWLALPYVVELAYEEPADCPMFCVMLADLHAFIFVDKAENFDLSLLEKLPKKFVVDVLESVVVLKPNEVGEWYWYLKDTGKTYHV